MRVLLPGTGAVPLRIARGFLGFDAELESLLIEHGFERPLTDVGESAGGAACGESDVLGTIYIATTAIYDVRGVHPAEPVEFSSSQSRVRAAAQEEETKGAKKLRGGYIKVFHARRPSNTMLSACLAKICSSNDHVA